MGTCCTSLGHYQDAISRFCDQLHIFSLGGAIDQEILAQYKTVAALNVGINLLHLALAEELGRGDHYLHALPMHLLPFP